MTIKEFVTYGDSLPLHPLSQEDSEMLLTLVMAERVNEPWEDIAKHWVFRAVEKRLQAMNIDYTSSALVFLCYKFESIGRITMIVHYIIAKMSGPVLNLDAIAQVFSDGFWSEADCKEFWKEQKLPNDENSVDQFLVDRIEKFA